MDGHIWIESEGVGKGSVVTFIVKLNVPEPPSHLSIQIAPTSQSSGSSQSRTDFSGVRVLVTDDNG
jgi:ethylene receptor